MFKENASVDGEYCSTHSGHDNDLRYLALTMEEKREIYGISFNFSFSLSSANRDEQIQTGGKQEETGIFRNFGQLELKKPKLFIMVFRPFPPFFCHFCQFFNFFFIKKSKICPIL